ncbi:inhibitor of carbonic anhydrase-like isoform X2 [Lepus europaeus]|uniref:inhibitor of carbonic anhydrase-like isoform X2 n=1 Tax=Lepus europaeus TaxID=9983 RepID=UPI002B4A2E23|nr:inhibitor of carbonic anhydrase-like isoform X2 [Lepus europaeus]
MRLSACALLCAGALGLCLADNERTVRWCTVSDHEAAKCSAFRDNIQKVSPADGPFVSCVRRTSYLECFLAIRANEADAVSVDGDSIVGAGQEPYLLRPIVIEYYMSKDGKPQTYHYAVAMVKRDTSFQLNQLQGKKSCHPGLWNIPVEALASHGSSAAAAAKVFSSSCVPCADAKTLPQLCELCAGRGKDKCACSSHEPYFGYSGAFKCLEDGAGDVSFVRHMTVFENLPHKADRDQYELLCPDNTRKPVDKYEQCHLARVPSHAVVARSVDGKEDLIWELLDRAQAHFGKDSTSGFQLFRSPYGRDLLFTDAAQGFIRVSPKINTKHVSSIQRLKRGVGDSHRVQWCAVGPHERAKCDQWSAVSGGALACTTEDSPEDCIAAIMKGEADAVSLDGGFIYVAGRCGLVPVLAESYDATNATEKLECVNRPIEDEFFSHSCAPGSAPDSRLCALCGGSSDSAHVCAPNSQEKYYGSSGALRCLVEKGDVAFVKHSVVLHNTGGRNPEAWAKDLKLEDFELLCLNGTRKPVTEAHSCHLGIVPNHAVVSRKEKADFVRRILFNQQELFGRDGFEYRMFQLFGSSSKDLLFSDDAECLANLQNKTTYEKHLGPEYLTAIADMKQCLTSKLLDACTLHGN